ncbi:peptidoglycan-binding protein [Methylocella sp.]|uniref:peptidoglycan-binding protein n=1 Tax=Methylocella sp. TaxID=1978226 RepID=UPI003783A504
MGRELSVGMSGEDVRLLQNLLNHHLSPPLPMLAADGWFGPHTLARVKEFQKRNRDYPSLTPFPAETAPEFRRPLKDDGIVGRLTANVLFDARTVCTRSPVLFSPNGDEARARRPFLLASAIGDADPAPAGDPPGPPPARTFRLVQLQIGQQATANPWSASPFVFTGQYVLLAKNDGRPDFLLTAGGQVAINDGGANGRWTAQGFVQMGLGGFDQVKLFGDKLDWFNPFVALMLSQNFKNNFGPQGAPTVGLAVGNQITWTLSSKPLPGTADDKQDTLSLFLNLQAVTNTDLSNGQSSAPGGQFLLGAIKTFF